MGNMSDTCQIHEFDARLISIRVLFCLPFILIKGLLCVMNISKEKDGMWINVFAFLERVGETERIEIMCNQRSCIAYIHNQVEVSFPKPLNQ